MVGTQCDENTDNSFAPSINTPNMPIKIKKNTGFTESVYFSVPLNDVREVNDPNKMLSGWKNDGLRFALASGGNKNLNYFKKLLYIYLLFFFSFCENAAKVGQRQCCDLNPIFSFPFFFSYFHILQGYMLHVRAISVSKHSISISVSKSQSHLDRTA